MSGQDEASEHRIEEFLGDPTRSLDGWRWLWKGDRRFPIRSHRGFLGRILVVWKRLWRPFVVTPQNDLWERQRVFNLILLDLLAERRQIDDQLERRSDRLEEFQREALEEMVAHDDALYALVDQKLDSYRREAKQLTVRLGELLAESSFADRSQALQRAFSESEYRQLEDRYRGEATEIESRIAAYLPILEGRGEVLDLGCGRGEALEVFAAQGIRARGVDSSGSMVAACQERGLEAVAGDIFELLSDERVGSLPAIVSFHVIEHLDPQAIPRLVKLAERALAPGGVLIFETPNPLSLVVAARNFWLDPTHRRPVHPEALRLTFEQAGLERVERRDLRPFAAYDHLPEIDSSNLAPELAELVDRLNRLRDRLDELLFGYQDYAMIGFKPAAG